MQLLEQVYFDNAVRTWLLALAVAIAAVIGLRILLVLATNRLRRFAQHTETAWDDIAVHAMSKTKRLFLLIVAAAVGSNVLALPDRARALIDMATVLAVLLQAGIWATAALRFGLAHQKETLMNEDRAAATSMAAVRFLGQVLIWSVVLLLSLDNLGIDVTALIAGLGVGGVAVALAVQNILGDLFASLAIVFDKPFVLGDFVTVGSQAGTVEAIGLKTTRIRSLGGEQLVFSNADLLGSRLHNFGRMEERRVLFSLGVTYQTTRQQLAEIPGVIRKVVEEQEGARFDRAHFFEYGDFSLNFEVVFYVKSPDYATYMDVRQAINLAVFGEFQERGVEFAYPTQTVFVERAAA